MKTVQPPKETAKEINQSKHKEKKNKFKRVTSKWRVILGMTLFFSRNVILRMFITYLPVWTC